MSNPKFSLVFGILTVLVGCSPFRPEFTENVIEGRQFAHYIRFPSGFPYPNLPEKHGYPGAPDERDSYFQNHLGFRVLPEAPDVLIVAGCGRFEQQEACSPKAFSIDTAKDYAVRPAKPGDWERGIQLLGDGWRRDSRIPIPPEFRNYSGIRGNEGRWFREKYYRSRGEWIVTLYLSASGDGKLVVLTGVDKRKLPTSSFLGDPVGGGAYGNFTLDAFDGDPGRKLAVVDVDCNRPSAVCLDYLSVVNSRWLAIPLARDLTRILLFDFVQH